MPIRDLLWACPICQTFASLRAAKRRRDVCMTCGTTFERAERATIRATLTDGSTRTHEARGWDRLMPPIESRFPPGSTEVLGPEPVRIRTVSGFTPVFADGRLAGWTERQSPSVRGTATLSPTELILARPDHRYEATRLDAITSIQPSSSTLQIGRRHRHVLSLRFESAPIRLWETVLQIRVASLYRQAGRGEVTEFQPAIRVRT